MSILEAILLGVVQGLTEFLPISSSGHLILVPWLQGYTFLQDHEAFNRTFDVALHVGTLVAVVVYFRAEVARLVRAGWHSLRARSIETTDERLAWAVAVATIPAVIVGGLAGDAIDEHLAEPWVIAIMLIVFGLLLAWADRRPQLRGVETITLREGFYVGAAQAIALIPGTSRSGVTITAGRYLGLDRDAAARFSFLLVIPAVAGAAVFKGYKAYDAGLPDGVGGPIVAGTIAAAVSGYAAIAGLLAFVRRHSYDGFAVYRVLVGVGCLILIATGARAATF